MTELLFVYGTLMSGAASSMGSEERARLAEEGRSLGPALLAARLYDLGRYPGVVEVQPWPAVGAGSAGIVHGEVYRLASPTATFAWLDLYEGIYPECAPHCEYTRDLAEVVLATAPQNVLRADVYVYRGGLDGARALPGGRWSALQPEQ